LKGSSPHEW